MKLLYQIDWLAPWPDAGGDHLTFYRLMSAAYSQRLALAKQYIEQCEHRPGCLYPCTCGRDALLKAMAPDQPDVVQSNAAAPERAGEREGSEAPEPRNTQHPLPQATPDGGNRQLADFERQRDRLMFCLMEMMQAYERRVRSDCTTTEHLSAKPWECSEYVKASRCMIAVAAEINATKGNSHHE